MDTINRLTVATLLLALAPGPQARADDDDEHEERGHGHQAGDFQDNQGQVLRGARLPGVAPASDPTYLAECGSCHMAYAPGLLPARSWVAILGGLEDHFGDVASLPLDRRQALARYLVPNAADTNPDHRLSARIASSVPPDQTPLRILDVPVLRSEHDEIPTRLVQANPLVKTWSRCDACHTGAANGSFREGEIRIPGDRGGWEE